MVSPFKYYIGSISRGGREMLRFMPSNTLFHLIALLLSCPPLHPPPPKYAVTITTDVKYLVESSILFTTVLGIAFLGDRLYLRLTILEFKEGLMARPN